MPLARRVSDVGEARHGEAMGLLESPFFDIET